MNILFNRRISDISSSIGCVVPKVELQNITLGKTFIQHISLGGKTSSKK